MSGRTKRILYYIADAVLCIALGGGMMFFPMFRVGEALALADDLAWAAALVLLIAGFPVLVHEGGHLLFGLMAGMKLAKFGFHPIRGKTAGSTAMYPKDGGHTKGKFLCFTLGGAAVNLSIGIVLFLLWLLLPDHPALIFCGALSGWMLYEGIRALIPCELLAGKTDGAVLLGLSTGRPEEEIALRVLTAQGILYRGTFGDVPHALLFEAPVVRADLPAYWALLLLKVQASFAAGEEDEAGELLQTALSAETEMDDDARAEFLRYSLVAMGAFRRKETPFFGINELENSLFEGNAARAARRENGEGAPPER